MYARCSEAEIRGCRALRPDVLLGPSLRPDVLLAWPLDITSVSADACRAGRGSDFLRSKSSSAVAAAQATYYVLQQQISDYNN